MSKYKNIFILKGGMLVAALVGNDIRSTVDMDTTIKKYPVTLDSIKNVFDLILSIDLDDGITMTIKLPPLRASSTERFNARLYLLMFSGVDSSVLYS